MGGAQGDRLTLQSSRNLQCDRERDHGGAASCVQHGGGQPLLAEADGCGAEVVAEVRRAVAAAAACATDEGAAARLLCMLQLLPSAVAAPREVLDLCVSFAEATTGSTVAPAATVAMPLAAAAAPMLQAEALRLAAGAAAIAAPGRLRELAELALAAVRWEAAPAPPAGICLHGHLLCASLAPGWFPRSCAKE